MSFRGRGDWPVAGRLGSCRVGLARELLPQAGPAGSLDHRRDGGAGVTFGRVLRPDVAVSVAFRGFLAPKVITFEPILSRQAALPS
jgi:hypothetical protein